MTPVRILIADDHELVRQGMRAILNREPAWVVCAEASTGRQALAKAMELRPDLMILDLSLPEMNGLEVTRRVRTVRPVPVLIVTVHSDDQAVQAERRHCRISRRRHIRPLAGVRTRPARRATSAAAQRKP